MLTEALIGIGVLIAAVYLGLPYRQAHLRRKELDRKRRLRQQHIEDPV